MTWTPTSWRGRPIRQQPRYADPVAVDAALTHVRRLPPLVHPGEIDRLRTQLAEAAEGKRFVLQGGDCAERFVDCNGRAIENKLKILLQMSVVLTWGARTPVVRVARMAGQFAKPRSSDTEVVEGREVPSYRGDHVNGFDVNDREPDPRRLVQAYFHSAATLNYVRALLDGGFADLHHPDHWTLDFVSDPARRAEYQDMLGQIGDAIHFMEATGSGAPTALRSVQFFTSHEGLLLDYEEALTRKVDGRWFNTGAHMLWIGHRTRQLDSAHVEYFRGIENPVGVKVGPGTEPEGLVELIDRLNPKNTPGRVTLFSRFGAGGLEEQLVPLIEAVKRSGKAVTWSCDPMHGNTRLAENGFKTRDFDDIRAELRVAFDAHRRAGSHLAGVHFELTAEDVTECTGGPQGLGVEDLSRSYETFCDPRLNYAQSLEIAFLIAQRLQGERER
ncbi:MAG: 3-deoxy-7-phosphoheptulonate synthase class II [Alphaproteobacteria bacterium]|nr:3-deoxy-7-phosphoheptulonate synthase class II [Alphaproteobacteria bacterium]MCB9795452.1 3-deoxy-7-phosphoheptulonate synthase class II [Alphaproteobacteria bacterium]